MRYFAASVVLAGLASLANAAAVDNVYQRDAALSVTLVKIGNAEVKATIKNVGAKSLKLMKYGTIFDDEAPIEKLTVSTAESKIPFEGVLRSIKTTDLTEDVFYLLEAGATYETTIDAAAVHTLETGKYSVVASGALPYAEVGSTVLSGDAVAYKSNVVDLDVDGEEAKKSKKAVLAIAERTVLQTGCTAAQRTATVNGLSKRVFLKCVTVVSIMC
jgi:deuterolysin